MTSSNAAPADTGRQLPDPSPPPGIPPATEPEPAAVPTTTSATTIATIDANAPIPLTNQQDTYRDDPQDAYSMPSPPTVSPLSTPAATQINVGDNEDVPDLTTEPLQNTNGAAELSSAAQLASVNLSLITESFPMELNQSQMLDQNSRSRNQLEAVATTDPDPANMDYANRNTSNLRQNQGTIDPNAYMMSVAQNAAALYQNPPVPSIVAPSEVSLQASFTQESDALTTTNEHTSTSASQKLESFARIEFADSVFQMTTYAVIIGRDQRAMDQARRDEKRELNYRRKVEENARNGLPPPTPLNFDRGKFSKSYVSEEGGMLGPESDGEDNVRPTKKRRPSSAKRSEDGGGDDAQSDHVKSNRQYVSHTPGAAAVDLGTLQPSPSHIPFVGIHSPGPDIASKTRGISRQHLKIEFNEKKGVFEAAALHKNGFFCDDTHYGLDDPVILRSGDRLQIKDVEFSFILNGVEVGKTGGEEFHEEETSSKRMSIGGKEMSFDFEHSDHENFRDTSEDLSEIENVPTPVIVSDEGEGEAEAEAEEAEHEAAEAESDIGDEPSMELLESAEVQDMSQGQFATTDMPKRRGPGRPPKDGIMSKRERRLLKKQMQETSKKTIPQDPQSEKIKRPVGRPRKIPVPEDGEKPEKRKYNKRKSKEDGDEGSDAERRAKEKKEKKVRPKSPPLELRKEDFTEEQLQKPTKNYGVLIDEALTNGPPDGLTLKQIYKRIMSKYPWFYFSAETKGWESSVRHNLIGNEAFKKAEGTGLWSRVPGVELDAGKKRKASSPDRQLGSAHLHSHLPHQYYQNGAYLQPNNLGYAPNMPNYQTDGKQLQGGYQPPAGQPTQPLSTPSSQPITQPGYPAQIPAPAQLPPSYLSRQTNNAQQSTYSSPYAKPPPPTNPPIKSEVPAAPTPQALPPAPVQQQQNVAQPSVQHQPQPVSNTPSTTTQQPLSPEIEKAISQFRANMLGALSKQTNQAGQIIDSAICRARGVPPQTTVPSGFEPVEKALINALANMISDMQSKQQRQATSASPAPAWPNAAKSTPTPTAPTPSPAPSATLAAEIQRRVKNFRDNMVVALKKKTDQAEAIVDLAIDRAQGLPNTGPIQGWEEADRLMVKSVTQIISDARRAHNLQTPVTPSAPTAPAQQTHPPQPSQSAPRQGPSASPAPMQSPMLTSGSVQNNQGVATTTPNVQPSQMPSSNAPRPTPPSISRPGVSIQRPGITRPGVNSISRPSVVRKDSAGTPGVVVGPSVSAPTHNVSSPAPPSAGVLDQITGQKRLHDDAFGNSGNSAGAADRPEPVKAPTPVTTTPNLSTPAPPSAGVVDQIGQKRIHEDTQLHSNGNSNGNVGVAEQQPPEPTAKTITPAPAPAPAPTPAPAPSMCSPAPPSAGVVDQIAGQKRHLDDGPGSASSEQPEAKKPALSSV
ncbi:uncharacterized protein F4822DRAFT_400400 [Hypoxylon trugodes]|uniref:uncharacterized protein n=1 Tax=Hypoxylon trugodes TaxID=326681 RepID=UPI00219757F3|nr:uncharacterized protein F4822DRAFT_400400 [Hypoxylon trugodes]KAI1389974.1 hypothetical protein F4822DRAFT_400400 [Hypoxylon trugodes]